MATLVPEIENNAPGAFKMALEGILEYKEDYLRIGDPTEYRFAQRCIPGGWKVWQEVINSQEYLPTVNQWREELQAKLRSDALLRILEAATGETRDALGANKYIYEALAPKEDKRVGRPSREAIKQEAARLVDEDKIREEAYNRLFKDALQED